jgi:hypothetical protein
VVLVSRRGYIMTQTRTEAKSISWVVTFPQENMIVRRPSLKRICQGNADLAELMSYFLFEASKETARQGIDPEQVRSVTLYRTQEDVLYGIDYNTSRKSLSKNISKLEQLGFLKAISLQHAYVVFVENIQQALALFSQERQKPHAKLLLPPTAICVRGQSCGNCMQPCVITDCVNLPNDCVDLLNDCVSLPNDCVDLPNDCVDLPSPLCTFTQSNITPDPASQADAIHLEDAARYNRHNKDIIRDSNRECGGEADAITTTPSLSSPVHQSSLFLPQKDHQSSGKHKGNTPKMQKERKIIKDAEKDAEKLPEKPASDAPATVKAFLALADYYRGYCLTHSQKPNSPYRLALEAATTFVKRKKTLAEIDAVFAYMKGVDERFCDDWWPMQTVDIWHVMRHFDSMTRKMAHRRAYGPPSLAAPGATSSSQSTQSSQSSQASSGFPMQQMAEIMEMPLEERRLYLARQREQLQQQQH